jgi:hypothetical protein
MVPGVSHPPGAPPLQLKNAKIPLSPYFPTPSASHSLPSFSWRAPGTPFLSVSSSASWPHGASVRPYGCSLDGGSQSERSWSALKTRTHATCLSRALSHPLHSAIAFSCLERPRQAGERARGRLLPFSLAPLSSCRAGGQVARAAVARGRSVKVGAGVLRACVKPITLEHRQPRTLEQSPGST